MADNAPPSQNPADDGTMSGMLRSVFGKLLQGLDDMLPATIISYDRKKNRAMVQPMIAMVTTDNARVTRAQIASVPVLNIGGGNYVLSFNLKAGDPGWIKASDRDISLYLQNQQEEQPNTRRMHSFEDGLFIPDVMTRYQIDAEDEEHAVLQTLDGKTRLAVWPNKIKITAVQGLEVDGPLKVTGITTLENTLTVSGATALESTLEVAGRTQLVGGADVQNKPYEAHWHGGIARGEHQSNGPYQ